MIKVEVPTHVAGVMDFANGAVGTIITSFDVWARQPAAHRDLRHARARCACPTPTPSAARCACAAPASKEWTEVPLTHGYAENSRGIGVADMAYALRTGRPHRASGELAYHVLDVMHAFHDASREERHIDLASTVERPAPLPTGLAPFELD